MRAQFSSRTDYTGYLHWSFFYPEDGSVMILRKVQATRNYVPETAVKVSNPVQQEATPIPVQSPFP
jgi:hypothetical protein